MASLITDQAYLTRDQYRDASRLNARIRLHERFSTNPTGWASWLFDILDAFPQQLRLLELGCGSASLWRTCLARVRPGWEIILSDLSAGMLAEARQALLPGRDRFTFGQIDAQAIPYADGTFDLVIANFMLYHVPDRPAALAEIRRVLRPGGCLLAATGGSGHLRELNVWLRSVSRAADFTPFHNPFTLENGQEQLAPFFSRVSRRRYPDGLRITELEPLMAYIRSTVRAAQLSESALQDLARDLAGRLQSEGALLVTKDAGLFEAFK